MVKTTDLEHCKALCVAPLCKGIEFSVGRCELWTRPEGWLGMVAGVKNNLPQRDTSTLQQVCSGRCFCVEILGPRSLLLGLIDGSSEYSDILLDSPGLGLKSMPSILAAGVLLSGF